MEREYNDSHIDTGPIEEHDVFSPAIAVNIASSHCAYTDVWPG